MPKQFIEEKLNRFSKYLSDIGLLTGIDISNFQKKFYELNSNSINTIENLPEDPNLTSIYFKENLSNTIVSFYKSMPEDKQKLIALNIYMKYTLKQEELIKKALSKLFRLYLNKYFSYFTSKTKLKMEIQDITPINNINNNNNDNNKNNSMLNLKHQNLNISIYPDNYLNNNISKRNTNSLNVNFNTSNSNNTYLLNNNNSNDNSKNFSTMCNFDNYKKDKDFLLKVIENSMNYKTTTKKSTKNTIVNTSGSQLKKNKSNTSLLSRPFSKNKQKNKKENIDYLNKLSKSKTEHNLLPEKTTQYLKEKEEYEKNCTFKPKINNSYSFVYNNNYSHCSNNGSSIDRLYLDNKNRMARREMESLKKNHYESKEITFTPKLITSYGNKLQKNFNERLKDFDKTKENNMKKLTNIIEDEFKQKFTFTPQINNLPANTNTSKNSNKKIPAYKRLYQDNQDKMQRQEERIKQEMENIKLQTNTSLFYSNNISNLNNNISQSVSKNVDYKKIEELYNDYKNKKNRLKKTQEKVDLEAGLTFAPEIISNNKKYYDRINPDFYQREKNFLQRQQNYIDTYKKYLEKKESKMQKQYTNEEKEVIYNNIVERLYKDGVEKYIQKKNSTNISLNENNNYSYFNENKNMNKNMNINDEYEKEPEQERFGGQKFIDEKTNNNYLTISGDKIYNSTQVKMDFTKM